VGNLEEGLRWLNQTGTDVELLEESAKIEGQFLDNGKKLDRHYIWFQIS